MVFVISESSKVSGRMGVGGSLQKGPPAENVSESVVQTSERTAMVKSLPVPRLERPVLML